MTHGKISASMMCASIVDLKETLKIMEETSVDYLHIDVMDGDFVPNFGLGNDFIHELRELTSIPMDYHLMINEPEYKLKYFDIRDGDHVSIHYESTRQIHRALNELTKYPCKRFVAINPMTSIYVLEEILDHIDGINLLMVNPGFAGQKIVSGTIKKAEKLMNFLKAQNKENVIVEVDGNITFNNASLLRHMGAGMFVAGTSSIFQNDHATFKANILKLQDIIK